jgi:predicted nucleic acid-binding protein
MNGIDFIVDTNIMVYYQEGNPALEPYIDDFFSISEITIIELLGIKEIDSQMLNIRQQMISRCLVFYFDNRIRNKTIELKQKYYLKIPDAIIAATAIVNKKTLLTADKDFKKIIELNLLIIEP